MNALMLDTVKLSENREYLEILDQTLLPKTVKVLNIGKLEDIWEAIKVLRVRGAPASYCRTWNCSLFIKIGNKGYK